MQAQVRPASSTASSNLADILSRVLDAGVVIAGDIKIKIVDIELLSIQIRLVVASVDKAREMGLDWWRTNPEFCPGARPRKRVRAGARPASSRSLAGEATADGQRQSRGRREERGEAE